MEVREYIERTILNRLCKHRPDDQLVDVNEFNEIFNRMGNMRQRIISETRIPGFTDDDLDSFFFIKTHQVMRRGQWDKNRLPFGLFSISYRNLVRDILRMRERALNRGLQEDTLDYCYTLFSNTRPLDDDE